MRGITNATIPNRNTALDLDELDPSTVSSKDPSPTLDEASMMFEIILESIRSLFRIGILLRKSNSRDRFKRALQEPDSAFLSSFDVGYVSQKHPKTNGTGLATRLGDAIAKRRQFIRYCRDHRLHLYTDESLKDFKALAPDSPQVGFEDDSITVPTVSTISDSTSSLRLPRLADLCQNLEPFECPICCTLQSFTSESAWR